MRLTKEKYHIIFHQIKKLNPSSNILKRLYTFLYFRLAYKLNDTCILLVIYRNNGLTNLIPEELDRFFKFEFCELQ